MSGKHKLNTNSCSTYVCRSAIESQSVLYCVTPICTDYRITCLFHRDVWGWDLISCYHYNAQIISRTYLLVKEFTRNICPLQVYRKKRLLLWARTLWRRIRLRIWGRMRRILLLSHPLLPVECRDFRERSPSRPVQCQNPGTCPNRTSDALHVNVPSTLFLMLPSHFVLGPLPL